LPEFFSAPRGSVSLSACLIVQQGLHVDWIALDLFIAGKHRKINIGIIENNLAGDICSGSDSDRIEGGGDLV
jgi:hypothetical protein